MGERLARYDVEKQCAIDKGDRDQARKKKEQMEEYRKSVYQQLEVHNLLDMAMVRPERRAKYTCLMVGMLNARSLYHCREKNMIQSAFRIFVVAMSTDHRGIRVNPGPGSILSPAVSGPPSRPHQAPCVYRHIQKREENQDTPKPAVGGESCYTKV